jgi:hypothetical protein
MYVAFLATLTIRDIGPSDAARTNSISNRSQSKKVQVIVSVFDLRLKIQNDHEIKISSDSADQEQRDDPSSMIIRLTPCYSKRTVAQPTEGSLASAR